MAEIEFVPTITPEEWKEYEQKRAQRIVDNVGYEPETDYMKDSLKAGELPENVMETLKKSLS
jgi:hypothetical protein